MVNTPDPLVSLGPGGHVCHNGEIEPFPMFGHSFMCPTGEHPRGWQHSQGPHAMCTLCKGPEPSNGLFGSSLGASIGSDGGSEGWRRDDIRVLWVQDGWRDLVLVGSEEAVVVATERGAQGIFMLLAGEI